MFGCGAVGTTVPTDKVARESSPPPTADNNNVQGRGENKDRWWDKLPRAAWSRYRKVPQSQPWFEVYDLGRDVFAIYEPGQFEEVISYLIVGLERAILFDTGLGIGDMKRLVGELTKRPVTVVNSHTHYDHVGGNHQFETILNTDTAYTEKNRKGRLHAAVAEYVSAGWLAQPLPAGADAETYESKAWAATGRLRDGQTIDIGGRSIEVLLTPGHAPDSVCLLDRQRRQLFTGDTLYPAPLYAHVGGSDFAAYEATADRLAALSTVVDWVLPGHNEPRMEPAQLIQLRDAFKVIRDPATPFVPTDGAREYKFERFSLIVSEPPPWLE